MSILNRATNELPIAVIDFETTGLSPKTGARVVEVAVVRVDPGEQPRLVIDTLIDPQGPVYASEIHGITDDDVVGAPLFREMLDEIAEATQGAVIASYNAAFDLAFLEHELGRAGLGPVSAPYVCLMYLRPLLGAGPRCDLASACADVGLAAGAHQAADDALAEAYLWLAYREAARDHGLKTFGDLAALKPYKFTRSFSQVPFALQLARSVGTAPKSRTNPFPWASPNPWPPQLTLDLAAPTTRSTASRKAPAHFSSGPATQPAVTPQSARRIYWHALVDATDDLDATQDEIAYLGSLRTRYGIGDDEMRALHGRLFAERLLEMARDDQFTADEVQRAERLAVALGALGWCPGRAAMR